MKSLLKKFAKVRTQVMSLVLAFVVGAGSTGALLYKPVTTDSLQACFGDPQVNLVAQAQFFHETAKVPIQELIRQTKEDPNLDAKTKQEILDVLSFYQKNKNAKHGAAIEALVTCVNGKKIK